MKVRYPIFASLILIIALITPLFAQDHMAESAVRGSSINFDQDVTPDVIFGGGNANGAFTVSRSAGVEVGLRAKLRFDDNGSPQNTFNSNGDGTYTYIATVAPGRADNTGPWGFEWSINTNFGDSTNFNLIDLTYELGLDADPGPGTDFLTFDPITPTVDTPRWDHAIGNNSTGNGDGAVAPVGDGAAYSTLIQLNNVAQNSWRYAFFPLAPLDTFNAKLEGEYTIYLLARDPGGAEIVRTEIEVIVVKPELNVDQSVIPDVIFGAGNANSSFTTDQRNGIEIALRGKLRFNAVGSPENTFNSNGDGTYSFAAGQAVGQGPQTPVWAFEWAVNTDYRTNPSLENELALSDLRYEIGLDGDPGLSTEFLTFDLITPSLAAPFFDHAIGDNSTANGAGTSAGDPASYQNLIDNNNVAQNSWRYDFFLADALADFDPTVDGTYNVYLAAFDANDVEVGRTQVQFLIGAAQAGEVAEVDLVKTSNADGAQLPGDTFRYTLTVTNSDVATTQNLTLTDTLPNNVTLLNSSCNDGTMASINGLVLTFDLQELSSGEDVVCIVDVEVSGPGLIINQAVVSADNDFDQANNEASVTVFGGLVESVAETGDTPTPTDNDYTRINNAVQAVSPGMSITLNGTFDWNEANAFASWTLGSDGVAATGDDYSIYVPPGLGNFALTAQNLGDATILGPGDLPSVALEAFLLVFSAAGNPGIEISNLEMIDFDLTIGIFHDGGTINAYDNTTIINNRIVMPRDIIGPDEGFQNIGVHYAFGENILIADNLFEIPGDGVGDGTASPASIAMQSNTSGNAYDGLIIEDNVIQVLNAQSADPEFVLGIWENGNGLDVDITVRNNTFENLAAGNDPALNSQVGFRITSMSAAYSGNIVSGANLGYGWLPNRFGADWSARPSLDFNNNFAIDGQTGVSLESNGAGLFRDNDFSGNVDGILNNTAADRVSDATCNWWGAADGPSGEGSGSGSAVGEFVTFQPWNITPAGPCEGGFAVDVSIDKDTSDPGLKLVGDTFDYLLTIENDNADLASAINVEVTDILPANLTFNNGSCDDGTMASQSGQTISFALNNLAEGDTTICTINVTVNASGQISNTATVSADNDSNPANNSSTLVLESGLVQSVGLTGDEPTAVDNDYTRINNAVQAVQAGDVITLEGVFDWTEINAFESWALGSNGVSGNVDDFNILVPEGSGDFVLTANELGDARIVGPGDLAGVEFEGFLIIFSTDNRGIEISNLVIDNFDVSIGQYFTGGGVNVYDDTKIINNHIIMARDIAGSTVAGEGFQNIGIHFAFGDNIRIADNLIEIQGDSMSNGPLRSVSVGMQSNTSSGAYEGLVIENNTIRVLNAATIEPEIIIGIWENSNAFRKDILIQGNRFENIDPANDASLNAQQAFRFTSQRDELQDKGAIVQYNYVDGANVAYQWLPGRFNADWTDRDPLIFTGNTAINSEVAVRLDSNGSAIMSCNRFFNNAIGIEDVSGVGTPADTDVESTVDNNWWGCNGGPNSTNCDSIDPAATNVVFDSWLVAEFSAAPDVVAAGGNSSLTLDVTNNNDGVQLIDCLPDGVPVEFTATFGTVTPASTDTVSGIAPAGYIAAGTTGTDPLTAVIDGETLQIDIEVIGPPSIISVNPNPLPGNVSGSLVTITGGSFGSGSVVLIDGDSRAVTVIDANTAQLNLTAADLLISTNGGDIEFVLDNSAAPGGGVSEPVVVPVIDDSLFADGFET